jgi:hypothetical protein
VIALAIPAYIMDQGLKKKKESLENQMNWLYDRIQSLEKEMEVVRHRTLPPPPSTK